MLFRSVGKKKYAEYEDELQVLLAQGLQLQKELLSLVDADADVFQPLAAAYSLPAGTDEEKQLKTKQLAVASLAATEVPLAIAEKSHQAMLLCRRIADIGTKLAISDAGCAALFLNAAVQAARYNVLINLPLITDEDFVVDARRRIESSCAESERLCNEIRGTVDNRL